MDQEKYVPVFPTFKVKLPMRVKTSNKKKQPLNLNVYRNLHHRSLHAQKIKFGELAKKLLRGIPPLGVITLHYEVFVGSKRRLDVMNVGSIVDKYFSDCLTSYGIIEDDDYKHIPLISFAYGGLVKKEHVLVTITEIEPRKEAKPMRVLLDNDDIQKALTTYVGTMNIPNADGVSITVNDEGELTAEVMFHMGHGVVTEGAPEEAVPPKKRGRGGRPRGSKNLPKTQPEETADVDAPVQTGADDSSTGDTNVSEGEASETTDTETGELPGPKVKVTKKGNLFGDEETQSSEDDGEAEADPGDPPAPVVKKKKGSIFDS